MAGLIIGALALFFFGPSQLFHLPRYGLMNELYRSIWLMCIGLTLIGLSMSLVVVPMIPEIMESTLKSYNLEGEAPSILCDRASAIAITT